MLCGDGEGRERVAEREREEGRKRRKWKEGKEQEERREVKGERGRNGKTLKYTHTHRFTLTESRDGPHDVRWSLLHSSLALEQRNNHTSITTHS